MKTTLVLCSFTLAVAACGSDTKTHPDAMPTTASAVVAAGDFTAGDPGVLGAVATDSQAATANVAPAGAVGDDPLLRKVGGELFVVNRADGNSITILDANTFELVEQLATGPSSNPQDVAVVGNVLYAPVFGGSGIVVLTRGTTTINRVDLASDDPDGKPNCVSAAVVGNKLYIACELLDDSTFTPRGPGVVYVIDTASSNLVGKVTMQNKNPFGVFTKLPNGDLVIPTTDFAGGGCLEKITTGDNPASAGCVVTNAQLGVVTVSRVEIEPPSTMWIAAALPDFTHANLQKYDLDAGALGGAPVTPDTEVVGDVAMCPDGTLAISDQTMNASGIRLYKGGAEVTTSALAVGLPTKSANALVCY